MTPVDPPFFPRRQQVDAEAYSTCLTKDEGASEERRRPPSVPLENQLEILGEGRPDPCHPHLRGGRAGLHLFLLLVFCRLCDIIAKIELINNM